MSTDMRRICNILYLNEAADLQVFRHRLLDKFELVFSIQAAKAYEKLVTAK